MLTLNTPLVELHHHALPRIGQTTAHKLAVEIANITAKHDARQATVEDLLHYLPFRYEDRTNLKTISELAPGEMATVIAEVAATKTANLRGKMGMFEARFHDSSRSILIGKWFHGEYLNKVLMPGVSTRVSTPRRAASAIMRRNSRSGTK